jgi:hypothetical protein
MTWPLEKLVTDASREWNLSQRMILVLVCLPFVLLLTGAMAALIGKDAYKWFTREDGFAENMQVLFYSVAFLLGLIIARRLYRAGHRGIACLYLAGSLGLFFLIGEEISWGQRIFGWESTEFFKASNKQEETNFHNIYGVGYTFKWIQLLVGACGTLLPLLVLCPINLGRFQSKLRMLVPHYTLIVYFLPLFVWKIYRNFFEAPKEYYFVISEFNEVVELILSVGVALFMVLQLRRTEQSENPQIS